MTKSRNRKNHKQKAAAYKKRVLDARKSYEKNMRALYEKMQHEALEKQVSNNESQVEAVDDIDVGDFKLDD